MHKLWYSPFNIMLNFAQFEDGIDKSKNIGKTQVALYFTVLLL